MCIGMSVLMTTACSPSTRLSKVEVQSNLMQPAPPLQELSGTTGKDWMRWGVDTVDKYNQCALQIDILIRLKKK
jgi:hypothetical protein